MTFWWSQLFSNFAVISNVCSSWSGQSISLNGLPQYIAFFFCFVALHCIVEWPRKAALEVLRIQGAGVLPTILCCLAISATSNPPPDQPPLSLSTVPLQFCILQPAGVGIYLPSSLLLGLAKGYMKSLWCCMVHRKIFDLLIG